jgi:hypothetical protein
MPTAARPPAGGVDAAALDRCVGDNIQGLRATLRPRPAFLPALAP